MSNVPTRESAGSSPINPLRRGEWIGEYEILQRIRHGGMATLFLGRKHGVAGFARNAAIKVIHPHLSFSEEFVRMFADEARICSQISHPNVIHVEAFGQEQGLHYMVMEYLESCSLKELLKSYWRENRSLDPELGAHIVLQIAAGLHAAHESRGMDGQPLGIIHRDISPSNILLSTDGHVKIIDFGIAKSRGRLAETQGGQMLKGKLKYLAPEQAQTDTELDRRADIFSLGVVFWEVLVGRPLFESGSELALLKRLTEPNISPPSSINPKVPRELDAVVMSMLSQNPDGRPDTAWEVRRQIVAALPAAATRQSEELGKISKEIVAMHDDSDASIRSSAPLGFGSATGLSESIVRPPMSSYEEVVLERTVSGDKSPWQSKLFQVLLLCIAVMLVVLLGLNLRESGKTPAVATSQAAAANVAAATGPAAPAIGTDSAASGPTTIEDVATSDQAFGMVSVRSEQNAEIYLDGERVATGTLHKRDLKPGAYLLEVRLSGHKDFNRVVVVEAARTSIIEAPLVATSKRRTRSSRVNPSKPREPEQPTPVAPAAEPLKPKTKTPDCTTPFYFNDGKKIFKPACL